jgi:hypothetical protein
MHDDDDARAGALAGIELAAWQPPAPPAGTADAVIARMREPAAVPAAMSTLDLHGRPARRAWWIGGTLAAASVAALAAWGLTRAPRAGHGDLVATRARHLELDGSTADLDAGAELRWDRDRHRITAQQTHGSVRWTVADDDTLMIDSGGSPSAVTIEASGASLRVEVQMNLSDMRLLGATTLTAAAVAVVTVVVYAGHVKATSGGQTVNVIPGATLEMRPGRPPQVPTEPPPRPTEPLMVGATPGDVHALEDKLRAADERVAQLTAELAAREAEDLANAITVAPSVFDASRLEGDKNIGPDADTQRAIATAGKKLVGTFKLCINKRGAVSTVKVLKPTGFERYDQTIEQQMHTWKYRPFEVDGKPTPVCTAVTFVYTPDNAAPVVDPRRPPTHDAAPAPRDACATLDVEDITKQAAAQYSAGYAKAALALLTKGLACKQDARMYRIAAVYACAAHDLATARLYFAKVPVSGQAAVEQKCQLEGLDLRSP